jgi:hypothetical protein
MRMTTPAAERGMRVRILSDHESLPPGYENLFADARSDVFRSRAWLQNFERNGISPGDRMRLYAVESEADGAPLALLPAIFSRLYAAHPRARVLHFTQLEGLAYRPFCRPQSVGPLQAFERVLMFLRSVRNSYDVLRVSPLDATAPSAVDTAAVVRRARHPLQTYKLYRDRYETVSGGDSRAYLAARPEPLRERLESAGRALFQEGRARFRLVCAPDEVEQGWRDYQQIRDLSTRQMEPEPKPYLPGIMRVAAEAGALRLGFVDLDDKLAAVQLWIVSAGIGKCLRVWIIPQEREVLLHELLTQHLTAHLIDTDQVAELDFGAINDNFALNWAPQARDRLGLVAFNLSTWRGFKGTLRHVGPQLLRSAARRVLRGARDSRP